MRVRHKTTGEYYECTDSTQWLPDGSINNISQFGTQVKTWTGEFRMFDPHFLEPVEEQED